MRSVALLCLLLVIAGCGSSHHPIVSPTRIPTKAPTVVATSNHLRWGVIGVSDVSTLDPVLVSDPTSMSVSSLIYGGLVRLDGRLEVEPDAAARWTISPDGKRYVFTLRKDLRFAGGKPVTAQEIVYSLDRAMGGPNISSTASAYLQLIARDSRGVPKIEALGPDRIRIVLQHAAAHFLAELAFPVSFVPDPSVMKRYGASWTDHAAGFGPYEVEDWRHSKFLTLKANPYYYGTRPTIRTITVVFEGTEQAGLAAYRSGSIDVLTGLPPAQVFAGRLAGTVRVPLLAMDYLAFNTTRLPFARADVRRAFASVWSPAFVSNVMSAAAFPASGVLPEAFGLKGSSWKAGKSGASYLAHARYPHGKHFPTVTLILPQDQKLHELALALRRSWQRFLGVNVAVRQLNLSNYTQVLNSRSFDLAFVRWGADYPDPQDFLGTQLGASPLNVTGWKGKKYDRLIPEADTYQPGDPRRNSLFAEAARLAAKPMPLMPMDTPAMEALIRGGLTGVNLTALGTLSIDPSTLRLISN